MSPTAALRFAEPEDEDEEEEKIAEEEEVEWCIMCKELCQHQRM